MMEYTDRHFRHLVRLISSQTLLYTEMVAANALAHEKQAADQAYREENPQADETEIWTNYNDQFLRRYLGQGCVEPLEGPSVLQLGGSDPQQLHDACRTVMDMTARGWCDYTAINLNCGCPSPKVAGKGCFGAALMDDPKLVADLTQAMHDGCGGRFPITVKCRIGTDSKQAFTQTAYNNMDPEKEYSDLCHFLETVAANGVVSDFSIHARIAVIAKSFSPADNRKIPPLKYNLVHRLVDDYPDLNLSLNGGIDNLLQAQNELNACPGLAGVMIGRGWAADPWGFALADSLLYGKASDSCKNRFDILKLYGDHADKEEAMWDPVKIRRFIVKAVTPLFAGEANARKYRIALDEIAGIPKKLKSQGRSLEGTRPLSELILNAAMEHLSEETLFRTPEESYERILWEEKKRKDGKERSQTLTDWQTRRKIEEESIGSHLAPEEQTISRASTNLS
jgi:tRNA-dihydrouridine synthase A